MDIAVVTSLYPTPARPFEGIFAARRWEGMLARGHRVSVVHPLPFAPLPLGKYREIARAPRRETRGGIEIVRPRHLHLPGRPRGNADRFARRALWVLDARPRPDVVVCDYAWPASALAPLLAARGAGAPPCVVNGRGSDVLQVAGEAGLGASLAANLSAANGLCAVSQDLLSVMTGLVPRDDVPSVLVPNGVDTELFRPGDRGAARRELGLQVDCPWVIVVGHLIPRKDPLLALEVFHRGAPDGARLAFVGRGPLAEALASRADALGLSGRVHFAGERPPEELGRWYRAADALLLTSAREGRPNVVLEALATGTPVLATAAGGTGEVLSDPRWLAEGRDPALLGAMLAALLAAPPSRSELCALVEPLSWGHSLATLETLLEEVARRGR
ncbi:MAG: glycosyltransferase [Planctomycetota bacterium]